MTRLRAGTERAGKHRTLLNHRKPENRWLESLGARQFVLADHLKGENMKALLVACALAIAFPQPARLLRLKATRPMDRPSPP